MTDDLRTQLQTTLGDGYTLERELGGGGMSRVFVAHENALGRTVVVKVIAPELAEGVSAEDLVRDIMRAVPAPEKVLERHDRAANAGRGSAPP